MGHSSFQDEDGDDEEEFEEEEEEGGGRANRLLGFMFGNVDNSGDLDVDYLDEDAKEHLAALADKLVTAIDIDLSEKSPRTPADTADIDYNEKAEDAVDYEDIEEQYEDPDTQVVSEDYLLPKKEFFASDIHLSSSGPTAFVFDDENYDEEEEGQKEEEVDIPKKVHYASGEQEIVIGEALEAQKSSDDDIQFESSDNENMVADAVPFQNVADVLEEELDGREPTPLPILCVEDGMVILRFSEIFGIHEPLKKRDKRDRGYVAHKEKYNIIEASGFVEEDEEAFLRSSSRDVSFIEQESAVQLDISESNDDTSLRGDSTINVQNEEFTRDYNLIAMPMKEELDRSISSFWQSSLSEEFILLEHEDWEEKILWDNSPVGADISLGSPDIAASDVEASVARVVLGTELQNRVLEQSIVNDKNQNTSILRSNVSLESLGSRNPSGSADLLPSDKKLHPQLLRLEAQLDEDTIEHAADKMEDSIEKPSISRVVSRFRELTMLNRGIMDGSWLDDIIWEPNGAVPKPRLVLDLQDEKMLFEILDNKDSEHLQFHTGAMVITRCTNSSDSASPEISGHEVKPSWQFNIANDKFYVNRKVSQRLQSNTNKRMFHSFRVHHSAPALKLQTMKLKLSNKDLANFHRPKALWYPHANEVAVKQGKLHSQGSMRIIVKSLGGKGSKVHVDAEEPVSSIKVKATKKLDFKPTETVKLFYLGKELEDDKSLIAQNVQTNSLLYLIRTKIHLLPKAQKVPGEDKAVRPPGAFKKKSDLSAKDGRVFLMEYCEERPLLLSNAGMGANLVTYYQKSAPGDQHSSLLRSANRCLGNILVLEPGDRSPFLGEIKAGCSQSSLETNMYKAPIFPHKVQSTDFLLIRSTKGKLSIRRIDKIAVLGQQEPLMEVISPGSKNLQTYIMNRMLVYVYRQFSSSTKRGLLPCVGTNELASQFHNLSEAVVRKKLKECATLKRDKSGQLTWYMKTDFHIPPEGALRKLVPPEHVCAYESMLAGLHRLKHLGITRLTSPTGVSSAMSQLPDEAIALAGASHIERELQITPWNLSSNFVACTNQDRENIERLEITGVGDPTGRGLGFSYVRVTPKAPMSSAMAKKKAAAGRGGTSVTGTDADLRRLSMEAAREVLLKFNVPDEVIERQTRWHRIAMIRKLSSEQAASGVKVDPTTIGKYARGQRMSFLQLQQQTREKCQEIWDRQILSLSTVEGEENESDSEANSDLDSFAGDLENLLDAEEFEEGEEGSRDSKHAKVDGVKGLKMRRNPSNTRVEEEIEDEAAEAAELYRLLMDDDEGEQKKKKKKKNKGVMEDSGFSFGSQPSVNVDNVERVQKTSFIAKPVISNSQPNGSYHANDTISGDPKDEENSVSKRNVYGKMKGVKKNGVSNTGQVTKVKIVDSIIKNPNLTLKKSSRESFVCGACGQPGHMRTNKHCPKYGEDPETPMENVVSEKAPAKSISVDPAGQLQQKAVKKKHTPKTAAKTALVEAIENEKPSSTNKVVPLKFKCSTDKAVVDAAQSSGQPVTSDFETGSKSGTKVIIKSSKGKQEQTQVESHRSLIVGRTSVDSNGGQAELQKPVVVIKPPTNRDRDQIELQKPISICRPKDREREQRRKIKIKRPKEVISLDQVSQDGGSHPEFRKTKKITEISSCQKHAGQDYHQIGRDVPRRKATEEHRFREEEEKRNTATLSFKEGGLRLLDETWRLAEYEENIRREREEEERQKENKKRTKKKKVEIDDFMDDYRSRRTERRIPERDRGLKRRSVMELGRYGTESVPPTKRRRGGEVVLSNILEQIVDTLKENTEVSYLFIKPVTKKEAPDYYDVIKKPMDLSKIREKVRKIEYKDRIEFRNDVVQIKENAHHYNELRNPGIPPLADQLLEICDYLIDQYQENLDEAEAGI